MLLKALSIHAIREDIMLYNRHYRQNIGLAPLQVQVNPCQFNDLMAKTEVILDDSGDLQVLLKIKHTYIKTNRVTKQRAKTLIDVYTSQVPDFPNTTFFTTDSDQFIQYAKEAIVRAIYFDNIL